MSSMQLDIVIFGGGVQGLWCLDQLNSLGYRVLLLENYSLGAGQTIAAQGIIHGGLKYTLSGRLTDSAIQVSDMPRRWREHLAGHGSPDLSRVRIRSEFCHLWRTNSLKSRVGMWGAKLGLNVRPEVIDEADKPHILKKWQVMKLAEPVISPPSLLKELALANEKSLCQYEKLDQGSIRFEGGRWSFTAIQDNQKIEIDSRQIILTAGNGNEALARAFKLKGDRWHMQRRPLHLAQIKATPKSLPDLNAHCLDGQKTRITVTTDAASDGDRVWQVGGDISEKFADESPEALLSFARKEIAELLPELDQSKLLWSTWHGMRAERKTGDGNRPSQFSLIDHEDQKVMVVWPTKMVLAPVVAEEIAKTIQKRYSPDSESFQRPDHLISPAIATPPWELPQDQWRMTEHIDL